MTAFPLTRNGKPPKINGSLRDAAIKRLEAIGFSVIAGHAGNATLRRSGGGDCLFVTPKGRLTKGRSMATAKWVRLEEIEREHADRS